jgi:anti-anti-sigma factor
VSGLVDVEIERRDEVVVARLSGELDLAGAPEAGDSLREAVSPATRTLVIDCSELVFIDSSGVAMLFSLARRLANQRQQLRVVAPDGAAVARVLELVDFHRAAPIHGELGEALAGAYSDPQ